MSRFIFLDITMFFMRSYEEEMQIQKAISFLSDAITTSGHNSKPVILHSVRVAMLLYNNNYKTDIVIGALLHDLLEDTAITAADIENTFGSAVQKLVKACSFDERIADKKERYVEAIDRAVLAGKDALIIKAADFYDNMNYYHLAKKADERGLWEKLTYFIAASNDVLNDDQILLLLKEKYVKIKPEGFKEIMF